MQRISKGKKELYLALIVGITALAVYGIHNTAQAFNDLNQAQTTLALNTSSSDITVRLNPGGTLCSYYGCSGCSGCVNQQFQQSTAVTQVDTNTSAIAQW
jgi:hypothetical protein